MSSRQWTPRVCGTHRLPWSPSAGKHSRAQGIRVSYFTIGNMFHLSLGKRCEKMHLTLGWAFVKSYVNVLTEGTTTFPRTSGTTDEKRSSDPLQIVSPRGETVKQKQLNQWGMSSPECLSLDLRDTAGNFCQKKCLFIDWAIGSACHADSTSIFSINHVGWYCNSLFCHVLPGKKNRSVNRCSNQTKARSAGKAKRLGSSFMFCGAQGIHFRIAF